MSDHRLASAFHGLDVYLELALTNHLLVILVSCVYLSGLYKYFHTVIALWAWYQEFLGSTHELAAMQEVIRTTDEYHDPVMRETKNSTMRMKADNPVLSSMSKHYCLLIVILPPPAFFSVVARSFPVDEHPFHYGFIYARLGNLHITAHTVPLYAEGSVQSMTASNGQMHLPLLTVQEVLFATHIRVFISGNVHVWVRYA